MNFKVNKGEIFGLLGPNGAGRTTTIHMLMGLTNPTSGTSSIAGRDCVREGLAIKQRIGLVAEEIALYEINVKSVEPDNALLCE